MLRSAVLTFLEREEMQSLFDPHIKSMLKKIREQLDLVQRKAFGNPQVVSVSSWLVSGYPLLTLGERNF